MRILVAGASGFIGRVVTAALIEAGHTVVAVCRTAPLEGVEHIVADVGAGPLQAEGFGDIDAIVNLVGIAIERGANTFEAAHIDAVEHLLTLARALDVRRFIHISVVRPEASDGAYHRTKLEGEARVRASDRTWTIVRPGLVYGPGDAMLSNLVRFVRLAPVFVAPGGTTGPLQTVDVDDVAQAVRRCLERDSTIEQTLDVVGPERTDLPGLVQAVAEALENPTATLRLPAGLMRFGAGMMERFLPNPPVTPTQLGMLIDGLYGEHEHARTHLGFTPRPLSPERIREVASTIHSPSLRLLPTADDRRDANAWSAPVLYPVLAVVALLLGPWVVEDLWLRMLGLEAALVGALWFSGAPMGTWLRGRARDVGIGLGAAAPMVLAALGVVALLRETAPGLMRETANVYGWTSTWPLALTVVLLPLIAGAEDLVWRFGITVGLCRRLGPVGAWVIGAGAFALAHATSGPPVLVLAAFLAGLAWGALALRTRAWWAVLTCHVAWDASILWLAP